MRLLKQLTISLVFSFLLVAVFAATITEANNCVWETKQRSLADVDPETDGNQPGIKMMVRRPLSLSAVSVDDLKECITIDDILWEDYTGYKSIQSMTSPYTAFEKENYGEDPTQNGNLVCYRVFIASGGSSSNNSPVFSVLPSTVESYTIKVFSDNSSYLSAVTLSIAENTAANVNIVGTITATDPDGHTLTYSLSGTDASHFSIDTSTGKIKTSSALDFETKRTYTLTLTASDGRGRFGTATVTVTIKVTDQNDPPIFSDGTSTTRTVAENTASGSTIGSPLAATDPDTNDTLTYSMSGADATSFSIDSSTGQLRTAAALDYETKSRYTITINVSDGNGGSDSISVTINVTDIDETITPSVQQPQPDSQPEPNYTIIPFDYEMEGVGKVMLSELMLARLNRPQWIELYNTTNQDIDINGWKIVGRYLDDSNTINILESQVISKVLTLKSKETFLIVSYTIPDVRERISIGLADKVDALGSNNKNFWNYAGFVLELQDVQGNPIDRIGNLNEQNKIIWEIPSMVRSERVSLIRRLRSIRSQEYNFTFGVKKFGWFPANEVERLAKGRIQYYYGSSTDIGSPGYRTKEGEILPVTLSSFNPHINQEGSVVISWITESEVDNAGFNILRSTAKKGPFVRVNPKLIQGAGTTGERNVYTWIDTAVKPNIDYYYQIEDVSFAGIKQTLATKRTKGIFTAKNKLLIRWGDLKAKP